MTPQCVITNGRYYHSGIHVVHNILINSPHLAPTSGCLKTRYSPLFLNTLFSSSAIFTRSILSTRATYIYIQLYVGLSHLENCILWIPTSLKIKPISYSIKHLALTEKVCCNCTAVFTSDGFAFFSFHL